jgi:hypothetical protein
MWVEVDYEIEAAASSILIPVARMIPSELVGPTSWTLAGMGPSAGRGCASAGSPARFTGFVSDV